MMTQTSAHNSYEIAYRKEGPQLFILPSGEFNLKNCMAFAEQMRREIASQNARLVTVDFTDVSYLDSAAAMTLVRMQKELVSRSIPCQFIRLNDDIKGIFGVIHAEALDQPPLKTPHAHDSFVSQVGQASLNIARDFIDFVSFIGAVIAGLYQTIRNPRSLRHQDVLYYIQRAGVDGLPIVALIGLLIGLIIAFMSFLQLRPLGANIYVPALVSFGMVKELGPIMTAILVAGRSGSAYAAEIGTMLVNEEVDALQTMGFDPIRFLAVPKVLATIIVVPILTIYADFFGVLGGMIIGVTTLDLTVTTYILQSIKTIKAFDIITSLIKAAVFAGVIAAIGCQRGFQVRSGAQDVGKFTTSAVVSAIFMIVVIDSIFAIMLYYMKRY